MSKAGDNLRFTDDNDWRRAEPDGTVGIGITDYGIRDLIFGCLPRDRACECHS